MIAIAWRSLTNRSFSVCLAILAIAMGVGLFLGIERVRASARASFEATIDGVDMIVGARGGDVQILLYSVFNIGNAAQNINHSSIDAIASDPAVAWVAPIALGDSHRGFRVVGTTNAFFDNVNAGPRSSRSEAQKGLRMAKGGKLDDPLSAVLGATAARELGYELGQPMIINHGLTSAGTAEHDNLPFEVRGILSPTGSPIDRNIYVTVEGIEAIHLGWRGGDGTPSRRPTVDSLGQFDLSPSTATAALVGLKNRLRVFAVQRYINEFEDEPLSAILPGIALGNLWAVMGVIEQSFAFIAGSSFVVAILGLMALLNMSLAQRRREMAIYRALGAKPWQIAALLMIEAAIIGVIAIAIGVVLTLGVEFLVSRFALDVVAVNLQFDAFGLSEVKALAGLMLATIFAGLVPALRVYRQSLSSGLSVNQ